MHSENIQLIIRIIILIFYILLLLIQIISLYKYVRKKQNKYWLYASITAILSSMTAIGIMFYYDSLPGYGFMPGLTYFNEWLYSFGAGIIFFVVFVISLLLKGFFILKEGIKKRK